MLSLGAVYRSQGHYDGQGISSTVIPTSLELFLSEDIPVRYVTANAVCGYIDP